MIKFYLQTAKYPNGGKMTMHMHSMKVGDTLEARGPLGHIKYLGRGSWKLEGHGEAVSGRICVQ